MTAHEALAKAHTQLSRLDTVHLDSEVLLAHVLHNSREYILAHPEHILTGAQDRAYNTLVARRARHEPVAYLTNRKAFYGRDFFVDAAVHIPRPATEDLIDAIKRDISECFDGTFADIGTGSGCIAITLALEFPKSSVYASDISKDALAVAEQNARDLGAAKRITFLCGSLGEPHKKQADIIAANLPYGWHEGWTEDAEVLFQPEISYISGAGGMDAIAELVAQLPRMLKKNGRAYLEYDPRRTKEMLAIAAQNGFRAAIIKDSAGFDRIACLTK